MTAVVTAVRRSGPVVTEGPGAAARLGWSWRLMRRGIVLVWLVVAAYMAIELVTFRSAYPDAASRQQLIRLSSSIAVRMFQGVPGAVDTPGGFAVWDGGWMTMLVLGGWAMLTVTRLTRGEEDSGRAELVLSRPVTARQALTAQLATMAVAAAGVAVAAALPFVVLGEPVSGAVLWGLGLGAFTLVAASLGAVVGQVLEPRRRAAAAGLGLLAAAFVLRVVANSADGRGWLLNLGPFGWVERLRAFSGERWVWLLAPAAAAVALGAAALALCGRRDTGAALVRPSSARPSDLRLLGTATGFAVRSAIGALLAWASGLVITAFVFGTMTGAVIDFIDNDETYRDLLRSMGMDMSVPALGFLSYIALFLALPFTAFLAWRMGATRQEEAEGRLDNLLTRGVVRWRWLTVTAAHNLLAAVGLVALTTASLWVGAALVDAPVTLAQLVEPMAGTLPLVALFAGLTVLVFGLAPRLTVAVPMTLAILGYLLDTIGAALGWPEAVLAVSPFHHLARLPGQPMTTTAIVVLTGLGVAAAAAGVAAFTRRDLRGA